MRSHLSVTTDPLYRSLPICTAYQRDRACIVEILECLYKRFVYMVEKHCRTLFIRFDLRFPADFNANGGDGIDPSAYVSEFFRRFSRRLSSMRLSPAYVWARELSSSSDLPHFHCVVLLNGSLTRSCFGHLDMADYHWRQVLGRPDAYGLVERCGRVGENQLSNGIMLRRNDPDFHETLAYAFNWSSYLAKVDSKDVIPKNKRCYGCSQIK